MWIKKPLFVQSINPRTVLTIIIWLTIAWILARPLKGIGEHTYLFLGSITNNTLKSFLQSKSDLGELFKAKKIIKEQFNTISLLKIKINYLENQLKETENLKNLLNVRKQVSYRTITTSVIGRSADNWHKQIILDKGENYKIMPGDSVLSKRGIIGQIVEVNKNTSLVQLISDPSYKLGCKIVKKNTLGILSASTNTIGLLEFIPIGTDIMIGDIVVTSGIGTGDLPPTYPSGHIVGKITKVSRKKSKASDLYIEVKLSEDLNSLSDVLVFSPS